MGNEPLRHRRRCLLHRAVASVSILNFNQGPCEEDRALLFLVLIRRYVIIFAVMHRWQLVLSQMKIWLRDHRKKIIGFFSFLIFLVLITPVLAGSSSDLTAPATTTPDTIDQIIIWLAKILADLSQLVVSLVVLIINILVVPILRYDQFMTSQVVGYGWSIVRDFVNMFFIVVLLIIAFQTIFGVSRTDWRKQVPRLLIMAIVVNFSRTIAGLLIDFGQVIMDTFVNAIKDIAGGNFISLFGLQDLYTYSTDAAVQKAQQNTGFGPFEFLGAAFFGLVISFVVLGTILTITFLFAFRIVILWVLIVLSPLAFFLGGAKGVIGPAEGYYSDWWKRFTSTVALGPILTFFLWLALASAGAGGTLAEKQGFDTTVNSGEENADSVAPNLVTKIFDLPHMTSLIIALALLFAGIEISQQTASSIGGSAGSMMGKGISGIPGLSRQLARIGIGAPAALGLAAGRAALPRESLLNTRNWTGKQLGNLGAAMASTRIPIISLAGRTVRDFGYGQVSKVNAKQEKMRGEAMQSLAGLGFDQLKQMAETKTTFATPYPERLKVQAAGIKMLTNKILLNKLSNEEVLQYGQNFYANAADLPEEVRDRVGKTGLMIAPQIAASDTGALNKIKRTDFGSDQAHQVALEAKKQEMVDLQMAQVAKNTGNIRDLLPSSFDDRHAYNAMQRTKVSNTGKTVLEWVREGRAGIPLQNTLSEKEKEMITRQKDEFSENYSNFKQAQDLATAAQPSSPPSEAEATFFGTHQAEKLARGGDVEGVKTAPLKEAINRLTEAIGRLNSEQIRSGVVTPEMLDDQAFFKLFTDPKKNSAFGSLAQDNPVLMERVSEKLNESDAGAKRILDQEPQHRQAQETLKENILTRLAAGVGARAIGYDPVKGAFEDERAEETFRKIVVENPEVILDLGEVAGAAGTIGTAISNAITPAKIRELYGKVIQKETTPEGQGRLLEVLERLSLAMKNNKVAVEDLGSKMAEIERWKRRLGR